MISRLSVVFNLKKRVILPGTWRYLGQRCPNIHPASVPIAGKSIASITAELKSECYRVGRVQVSNAFLLVKDRARFLYVRPDFTGYRRVAKKVFPKVNWAADFDHSLSKRIALVAGYKYVLLLRVPPEANRAHGAYEKKDQLQSITPDVCFADDRVLDKWLGRSPTIRNRPVHVLSGYAVENVTVYGLTLKQRGHWAYAIGMDDVDLSMDGLTALDI